MVSTHRFVLFLLGIVLCAVLGLSECAPTSCYSSEAHYIDSESSRVSFSNFTVNIVPRAADGTLHPDSFVSIILHGFQELLRPGINCYESTTSFPITTSVALVQPYGAILTSEMMCDYQLVEWQADDDVFMRTMRVLATHDAHSNFSLEFNVTISSQDFNTSSHYSPTQNISYDSVYKKNQPKFAFQLNNWPWQSLDPDSYLFAYWNIDFYLPGTFSVKSYREGNTTHLAMKTLDGQLEYGYEVAQSFVLGDKHLVRQLVDFGFDQDSVTMDNTNITLMRLFGISFSFCEIEAPGFQYNSLFYDPTLTALFNPPPTPQTEEEAAKKKKNSGLSGPQIAGVIIACLFVASFAALLVVLWLKPDLRTVFRPFRKL